MSINWWMTKQNVKFSLHKTSFVQAHWGQSESDSDVYSHMTHMTSMFFYCAIFLVHVCPMTTLGCKIYLLSGNRGREKLRVVWKGK